MQYDINSRFGPVTDDFPGQALRLAPDVLYRHEPDSELHHEGLPFLLTSEPTAEMVDDAGSYLRGWGHVRNPRTAVLPLFPRAYRGLVRQRLYGASVVTANLLARLLGPRGEGRLRIPDLIDGCGRRQITMVIKSVRSLDRAALFIEANPSLRVVGPFIPRPLGNGCLPGR